MKGLLLVAHGSGMEAAKHEILNLAGKLRETMSRQYGVISAAFLQRASPSISEAIQDQVDRGVKEIVVVPYLLATGRHVAEDIPEALDRFRKSDPDLSISVVPHIGAAVGMPALIRNHVEDPPAKG